MFGLTLMQWEWGKNWKRWFIRGGPCHFRRRFLSRFRLKIAEAQGFQVFGKCNEKMKRRLSNNVNGGTPHAQPPYFWGHAFCIPGFFLLFFPLPALSLIMRTSDGWRVTEWVPIANLVTIPPFASFPLLDAADFDFGHRVGIWNRTNWIGVLLFIRKIWKHTFERSTQLNGSGIAYDNSEILNL